MTQDLVTGSQPDVTLVILVIINHSMTVIPLFEIRTPVSLIPVVIVVRQVLLSGSTGDQEGGQVRERVSSSRSGSSRCRGSGLGSSPAAALLLLLLLLKSATAAAG